MLKILAPILVLATLVAVVVSLDDERPRADVVLVHSTDLFTLDPQRMSYLHDLRAARAIYEPLATILPDGSVGPAAAESWVVSEDASRYVFHLRPGLRFSNGDPVTAEDFKYAWRRAILPDTAATYSSLFLGIAGARDFFDWRSDLLALRASPDRRDELVESGSLSAEEADAILAEDGESSFRRTLDRFDEMVGLDAVDEETLEVELQGPLPYFLDLVAFGTFSPVHRPTLEAATTIDPATGRIEEDRSWTKPGRLIGNGPFELARWRFQRDCRFEKNPFYWNAESIPADSIEAVVIQDPNTAILAFEAGEVDWIPDVRAEYRADMIAERLAYEARHEAVLAETDDSDLDRTLGTLPPPNAGERRNIHTVDAFGTDFFHVNCRDRLANGTPNPLADPRVRRALALCIDKTALVQRVTRLNETTSGAFVPEGSIPGYQPPAGLPFDPDRGRAELDAAGWRRDDDGVRRNAEGDPFPTLDILFSTGSPRYKDLSLALRDMWRRELQIPAEISGRPGNEYRAQLEMGNFMVARGGWYGDYGDPTTFLDLNHSEDGNNHRGYASPRYDELLATASSTLDPDARFRILEEAERILVEEDLPILPLCTYVTVYMYEPDRLLGLTRHPRLDQHPGRWSVRR